jgi:K+-transporting ATPase ATPase C chain
MKNILKQSLILTVLLIVLFAFVYPLLVVGIALIAPGKGSGVRIETNGKITGYENIGQKFTNDKYFNGRPSAVDHNAAGSGGSNKGPTNPDYLKTIQERIDTFLSHNPDIKREEIPADLVTASGSGLDPHISPKAAYIQVARISKERSVAPEKIKSLVDQSIEHALFGLLGPERINVLKFNIALDQIEK